MLNEQIDEREADLEEREAEDEEREAEDEGLSEEYKAAVIDELQAKFQLATADNIGVITREMIGPSPNSGLLTDESLQRLALGSDQMLRDARRNGCKRSAFSVLENNLALCVREALPGCNVVNHPTRAKAMGKPKFAGFGFAIKRRRPARP